MRFSTLIPGVLLTAASLSAAAPSSHTKDHSHGDHSPISPKAFIISMFSYEQDIWFEPLKLTKNITVPGLSPIYPQVHCTADYSICQMTTGEGEINAAVSATALTFSPLFDLRKTYFMIAGIAGINPYVSTIGAVTFGRFAVQLELEYEIDAREMPSNFSTGLWALGTTAPGLYPTSIYGTEVFELNVNLRDKAMKLAHGVKLNDSDTAAAYRKKYNYAPANKYPTIVACDTGSSNAYWSGELLGESFGNFTKLLTSGKGTYCATAQEDNATLEAMLRAHMAKRMDFARVVLLRSASDFDRPPPGETTLFNLVYADQGSFGISLENIVIAGSPFIKDVVKNWHEYEGGIAPSNYIGDIWGSLGGKPDFGQ
ncbi:purine nucleoside permease [Umbelopsis sp. AD052]|nr:purine nucleoside permease [Umbelopsis sp. AD052]